MAACMTTFYAIFIPVNFWSKASYQLWQTICSCIIFVFWVFNIFLFACMMHLLTDLLIFQSKMGAAQVSVRREDHFKQERRVIAFYALVYFTWLTSVIGLVFYGLSSVSTPYDFVVFNNYRWFYVNLSTSCVLICWLCCFYVRFVKISRKMYISVHLKYRNHWAILMIVALISLFSVLLMLFVNFSVPLNTF